MTVAVLEWRSRRQMSQVKRWITAPGHASLVLLFPDHSGKTHGFGHTITWFPSGTRHSSGKQEGSSVRAFGSKGKWVPQNIFHEMQHMGGDRSNARTLHEWLGENDNGWVKMYKDHLTNPRANFAFNEMLETQILPPDRQVSIMTRGDPDAYTGLFDSNIRTWWLAFADQHDTYKFLSRSCAAVVGMALVAGGAEQWVSKPAGFWTPDSVYGWAVQIKSAVEKENEKIRSAFESLKEEANKFPAPGEIWTRNEWYRASEANVSFLSRRYGLLQTIDSLLDVYHGIDARTNITKEFKEQAKANCLGLIMQNLTQILRERGTSKRKAAIGQLAAQIRGRFRAIQEEEQRIARELLERRELLEQQTRIHNEPINKRLKEIATEHFKLLMKMSSGKIKDVETMKQISLQMQLLKEEKSELEEELI